MDFLKLEGKTIAILGVANRKSVAWHIAKILEEAGAHVVYIVRSPERKESLAKLLEGREIHICDVEHEDQVAALPDAIKANHSELHGFVHSIAFADYEGVMKPFHETGKRQFLQAVDISCYSLIAVSNALKDLLTEDASVVTISISTTRMASENYGFMAPIKAALDS